MKYFLKAITTNNRDLKTAIYLGFEERAYLFNCPDGFQRLALNQKMRFQKVRKIFLSNMHPDYYGGFPGFYLSAKESYGLEIEPLKISVFGPKMLRKQIKKGKVFYSGIGPLEIYEYGKIADGPFTERNLKGKYVLAQFNNIKSDQIMRDLSKEEFNEEEKKESKMQLENYIDDLLSVTPVMVKSIDNKEQDCYSFICIPKQDRGKFLPKIAADLGCNPKQHFKTLSEGNPVTLDDGTIIYPHQVMEAATPSQSMIFFFLPNENYLDSLQSEESQKLFFQPYYQENIDSQKISISVIYHSIPLKILLNENYKQLMRKFGPNVRHIIDCHETNDETIARNKSWSLTSRHKIVCPALIPLSPIACKQYEKESQETLNKWLQDIQYFNARVGMIYNLYPLQGSGIDRTQEITNKEIINENEEKLNYEMETIMNSFFQLKDQEEPELKIRELANANTDIDDKEPIIMFLGTVSMKPTMYRSASAIYMFVKGSGILMDCAEGSYGQIYDHFQTIDKVNEAIFKLRLVFLTHIHGDHQLGIIKIMFERDRLLEEFNENNKLYIVTPEPMYEYMEGFKQQLKYPDMVVLVRSDDLNPEPRCYYGEEKDELFAQIKCPVRSLEEVNEMIAKHRPRTHQGKELYEVIEKIFNIRHLLAIETDHCVESYGCLFDSPDFGRIFYSGDTRPCQTVLNYCQKIKLLIHEATFEDALADDANWKRHTTMGQAMDIAEKCQPWRTVLTHFSPRYQKIAEICDRNFTSKTMVAFDHMRIRLSYFEWAYRFLEFYKKLFVNDDPETLAKKAIKKEEKKGGKQNLGKRKYHK